MNQSKNFIVSIGYGNRKIEAFISLLKTFGIQFLGDVRSKPYSKHNADFSRRPLEAVLNKNKIRYVFMGDALGGIPDDDSCYTDGRVDYQKIEQKEFYQNGIKRLLVANEKQIPLAIMCSESKPQECHRSKLIGETLKKYNVNLQHIDERENLLTQEQVISKAKENQLSIF